MGKRRSQHLRHIRLLTDGLIDEDGLRWDRITGSESFYMTPAEAEQFIASAGRFLRTDGYGSRADDVERQQYLRFVTQSPDHRVQAFRASDGSGRIISTIDTSDC